jgi:hypothetical protein
MKSVVVIDPRLGVLIEQAGRIESVFSSHFECILRNADDVIVRVGIGKVMGYSGVVRSTVGFTAVPIGPHAKVSLRERHIEVAQRTVKMVRDIPACMDDETVEELMEKAERSIEEGERLPSPDELEEEA